MKLNRTFKILVIIIKGDTQIKPPKSWVLKNSMEVKLYAAIALAFLTLASR